MRGVSGSVSRSPRLLVGTSAGVLYVYALDAADGGDCALLHTHQFLDAPHAAHATHATHAPHATHATHAAAQQHEGKPRTLVHEDRLATPRLPPASDAAVV